MMKIEIVEDTLTPWVDGSLNYLKNNRLDEVLKELLGEIYEIVEPDVPEQTGYLRGSGKEWHPISTGEAVGAEMIFSGADNPRQNREAYGWTSPPIYPDKPYAQHQYFDKKRQWFHSNWGDIKENVMATAELQYDSILKGWF